MQWISFLVKRSHLFNVKNAEKSAILEFPLLNYFISAQVIHGDLAARNVLLSENRVVKLCDFGLSRRVYYNNTYIKKGHV